MSGKLPHDLATLFEALAAQEHDRWAHWQRYVHSQGRRQPDGSIILPAELVARWERQIRTPYNDLTDGEKESDREQVRKYFQIIVKFVRRGGGSA